jgi:hypothetical protein
LTIFWSAVCLKPQRVDRQRRLIISVRQGLAERCELGQLVVRAIRSALVPGRSNAVGKTGVGNVHGSQKLKNIFLRSVLKIKAPCALGVAAPEDGRAPARQKSLPALRRSALLPP